MRLQSGLSLLLLATSACLVPTGPESETAPEVELTSQNEALLVTPVDRAGHVRPLASSQNFRVRPVLDNPPIFFDPTEYLCNTYPEQAATQFVVPRRGHCGDVHGARGTWNGEPAFPGVVSDLCRYVWNGDAAPEFSVIRDAAALLPSGSRFIPDRPRITADCRRTLASCESVASCDAASPALTPTRADLGPNLSTPGGTPCPACRGIVADRELLAVLSPELAATDVLRAVAVINGQEYDALLKPNGRQVVSYALTDAFPDTDHVDFFPMYFSGVWVDLP
jgi:hypothetical protein